jgi:hypothetical protein
VLLLGAQVDDGLHADFLELLKIAGREPGEVFGANDLTPANDALVAGLVAADVPGVGGSVQMNHPVVRQLGRKRRVEQRQDAEPDDGPVKPLFEPRRRFPHDCFSLLDDENSDGLYGNRQNFACPQGTAI